MVIFSLSAALVALRLFTVVSSAPAPTPEPATQAAAATSSYWLANIERTGTVPFGDASFQIFRNVMTFGAYVTPSPHECLFILLTRATVKVMESQYVLLLHCSKLM